MVERYVHHLVLEAFVGPCPPKHEGNHDDGDPRNNYVGNLEWVTSQENSQHAARVLRTVHPPVNDVRGELHGQSKLTDESVRRIRRLYASGTKQTVLAKRFRVAPSTVSTVVNRKRWSHVQ